MYMTEIPTVLDYISTPEQLTVQSTKLKAVQDVPLLPVAGQFFEGREFPTGDVTKAVRLQKR